MQSSIIQTWSRAHLTEHGKVNQYGCDDDFVFDEGVAGIRGKGQVTCAWRGTRVIEGSRQNTHTHTESFRLPFCFALSSHHAEYQKQNIVITLIHSYSWVLFGCPNSSSAIQHHTAIDSKGVKQQKIEASKKQFKCNKLLCEVHASLGLWSISKNYTDTGFITRNWPYSFKVEDPSFFKIFYPYTQFPNDPLKNSSDYQHRL